MIKIYPNTKVFVSAPASAVTGGPELLHQLAHHLRKDLGIESYMYYYPNNIPDPIHPAYKMYNVPFVREIEDKSDNILIVPEVISGINLLKDYKNIRKIIWWLSVDNFYLSILYEKKKFLLMKSISDKYKFNTMEIFYEKYGNNISNFPKSLKTYNLVYSAGFHLAQSRYAYNHLIKKFNLKENIFYLSDYLNKSFLETQTDMLNKENIVAYNPKKGFPFTKKIIYSAKDIRFIPLINMSREEVIKTLQRAKVYIDFGNHPGKDRLPREAAILGCCVITGKRGSAAFYEDVPIPDEYKFDDKEENIPKIIEKIKDCFENFEDKYKDFDYYRQVIKNEPQKFIKDIKEIFT